MEAARRRAVRDLREIAEEAEAPAGSDGAALRRRLAEPGRACSPSRGPSPPTRRRRRRAANGARRTRCDPTTRRPRRRPSPAPPAAEAPDAVAAAAGRLAEAAYRALERLFGVVDADYREAPARRARRRPSTPRRSRASGACWGPSRAAASGGASTRSTPPPTRPRQMMMMTPAAARPGARATPRFACWTRHRRDRRDPPRGSPEKRLSERLHAHPPCSRTGCVVCRRRCEDNALLQKELGVNDEAGPRELWAAVARPAPDFTQADLEASLWRGVTGSLPRSKSGPPAEPRRGAAEAPGPAVPTSAHRSLLALPGEGWGRAAPPNKPGPGRRPPPSRRSRASATRSGPRGRGPPGHAGHDGEAARSAAQRARSAASSASRASSTARPASRWRAKSSTSASGSAAAQSRARRGPVLLRRRSPALRRGPARGRGRGGREVLAERRVDGAREEIRVRIEIGKRRRLHSFLRNQTRDALHQQLVLERLLLRAQQPRGQRLAREARGGFRVLLAAALAVRVVADRRR